MSQMGRVRAGPVSKNTPPHPRQGALGGAGAPQEKPQPNLAKPRGGSSTWGSSTPTQPVSPPQLAAGPPVPGTARHRPASAAGGRDGCWGLQAPLPGPSREIQGNPGRKLTAQRPQVIRGGRAPLCRGTLEPGRRRAPTASPGLRPLADQHPDPGRLPGRRRRGGALRNREPSPVPGKGRGNCSRGPPTGGGAAGPEGAAPPSPAHVVAGLGCHVAGSPAGATCSPLMAPSGNGALTLLTSDFS